jgi:hypothetical protein
MGKIISRKLFADSLSKPRLDLGVGLVSQELFESVFFCFVGDWVPTDAATELDAEGFLDFVDADEDGDVFG